MQQLPHIKPKGMACDNHALGPGKRPMRSARAVEMLLKIEAEKADGQSQDDERQTHAGHFFFFSEPVIQALMSRKLTGSVTVMLLLKSAHKNAASAMP